MELPIVKTGAIPKKLNILVYGQAGTGKTTFLGSAEPRFKTLILSAEAGLLSLERKAKEIAKATGQAKFEYDTMPIKSMKDLALARDYLYNAKHEYTLVGLDSGTELQKVIIDEILQKKEAENSKTKGEIGVKDWGVLLNKMVSIIRAFRDLPRTSFVLTALSEEQKNEATGEISVVPAFDGKIKQTIDGYFDEVFYSFTAEKVDEQGVKSVRHGLLTRNNGRMRAKDRSGLLPLIVEPDFCKIYDMIHTEEVASEPAPASVPAGNDKQGA